MGVERETTGRGAEAGENHVGVVRTPTTSINGGIINRSSRASVKRLRARGEGKRTTEREGVPRSAEMHVKKKKRKQKKKKVKLRKYLANDDYHTSSSVLDYVRRHLKTDRQQCSIQWIAKSFFFFFYSKCNNSRERDVIRVIGVTFLSDAGSRLTFLIRNSLTFHSFCEFRSLKWASSIDIAVLLIYLVGAINWTDFSRRFDVSFTTSATCTWIFSSNARLAISENINRQFRRENSFAEIRSVSILRSIA